MVCTASPGIATGAATGSVLLPQRMVETIPRAPITGTPAKVVAKAVCTCPVKTPMTLS